MTTHIVEQHQNQQKHRSRRLRWWERILERVASTRLGGWFYVHAAMHIDREIMPLSRGRLRCSVTWSSLLLTTKGARSGQSHTVPLLYLADGERLLLVASNGGRPFHPSWYHNLLAYPEVEVLLGHERRSYQASVAGEEERKQWWPRMVDFYQGYEHYQQCNGGRVIPVIVLTPR